MHTEATLAIMDEVTIALGQSLREFQGKTCSAYDTKELRREADARKKRRGKTAAMPLGAAANSQAPPKVPNAGVTDPIAGPSNGVAGSAKGMEEPKEVDDAGAAKHPIGTSKKRKRAIKASQRKLPDSEDTNMALSDRLTRLKKSLNLNTYKNHSLGDYTNAIRRYGTTDSYSTESVCSLQPSL